MSRRTRTRIVYSTVNLPKTHDATKIPAEWNAHWEKLCAQDIFSPKTCLSHAMSDQQRTSERIFDQYSELLQNTREVQYRIGIRGLHALTNLDFEQRWEKASVEDRRKHVLIGLSEPCASARNLNEARMYCGDVLKLRHLSQDAHVLLNLLSDIIPQDASVVPAAPYFIPNESWDRFIAEKERNGMTELEKAYIAEAMILRTELIYFVVEFTMMSFLGMEIPKITVSKDHHRKEDRNTQNPDLAKLHKKLVEQSHGKQLIREELKSEKVALKDRLSKRRTRCAQSDCDQYEAAGENFRACSRCRESGMRTTQYCSKECQTKDWKARHKAICGKALDFEAAVKAAVPRMPDTPGTSQIGPSIPPFKRNPALINHIRQLSLHPTVDFVLRTSSLPDREQITHLDFPFEPVQKLVRSHREIAMTTGDKTAVAKLCQFIVWFGMAKHLDQMYGWEFETVIQQMAKEFAFPELKAAMIEMQTLQFRDAFQRPPLLLTLDPPLWAHYLKDSPVDMNMRIT